MRRVQRHGDTASAGAVGAGVGGLLANQMAGHEAVIPYRKCVVTKKFMTRIKVSGFSHTTTSLEVIRRCSHTHFIVLFIIT
jgi:hypothetical protein